MFPGSCLCSFSCAKVAFFVQVGARNSRQPRSCSARWLGTRNSIFPARHSIASGCRGKCTKRRREPARWVAGVGWTMDRARTVRLAPAIHTCRVVQRGGGLLPIYTARSAPPLAVAAAAGGGRVARCMLLLHVQCSICDACVARHRSAREQ